MKKPLCLLLCYVFLQTQTFALSGGPTSSTGDKVIGAYSGSMTENNNGSSIGLFLLNAVSNGASSGQVVVFSSADDDIYLGSITGLSDTSRGGTGKFIGLFTGNSVGTANTTIGGKVSVTVVPKSGNNAQRLTGTATSRSVGVTKNYTVDGWRTSVSEVGAGFSVSANK